MYKTFYIKRIKSLFRVAAKHKKLWRCLELLEKIKNQKKDAYNYIMKAGILQGNITGARRYRRDQTGTAPSGNRNRAQRNRTRRRVFVSASGTVEEPQSQPAQQEEQIPEEELHKEM